ncbi:hypothetical protein [Cellulomonas sp. URHD0024]|uniref:hypothetical protein n=1 Tax=Cellulomonas sp. URHD0024 TaxID=1302620 RepID=UPI00040BAED1|nr:hypothetical protein [Cellulomonas sp. URHD0024]
MNTLTLRRLSGVAAIAAGPLCLLGGVLHPVVEGRAHSAEALAGPHATGSLALLLGTVLLLLGLPGVYGWIAPRLGTLGLIGYVLYFLGNMLSAVPHLVLMAFAASDVARTHPEVISDQDAIIGAPGFEVEQLTTGLGIMLGLLLLGIALLRGHVVPRWIGWAGLAGALVMLAPLPAMPVASGLQIELLRGAMIVGLGAMAVRSTQERPVAIEREQVAAL